MSKDRLELECNHYQFHDLNVIVAKYETKKSPTVVVDKVALGALLRDHGRLIRKIKDIGGISINEDPTDKVTEDA